MYLQTSVRFRSGPPTQRLSSDSLFFERSIMPPCSTCNGACCYLFMLRWSKRDLLLRLSGKGMFRNLKVSTFEIIKQLTFLRDATSQFEKNRDPSVRFFTCLAFSNNRCSIYKYRMAFCEPYDCKGTKQIAHTMSLDGKPPLPIMNQEVDIDRQTDYSLQVARRPVLIS